jgi:hypothetical protein
MRTRVTLETFTLKERPELEEQVGWLERAGPTFFCTAT